MHVEAHDTAEELRNAMKAERDGRVRDRIRGVMLAKQGRIAKEVAVELGVSPRAVQDWIRWYNEGGLKNLPDAPRSGQPRKCAREKFDAIRKRILEGPKPDDKACTLRGPEIQRLLAREFGVVMELSSTYNLLHALELSPLRPRPRHNKNDPEAMKTWERSAPFFSSRSASDTRTSRWRSGSRTRHGSASRAR